MGARIGTLLGGVLKHTLGGNRLDALIWAVAGLLVLFIRHKAVTRLHEVEDAPLQHVAMPDSMASSPLSVALDPRVDEQVVQDKMQTEADVEPGSDTDEEPAVADVDEAVEEVADKPG